ncbi:MAG: polysaccharide biosynthesis tyrosine autokinase [Lachnospiraceae bacterium]
MKENYRTSSDSGSFSAFSNPDYYTLLKDVAKNWWVIALTGVIVTLIFRILPMIGYTPTYTASTTVMVTGTIRNDDSFSTYSSTAQQFANLLTDDYLLQEIAEDMQVRKLNVKVNASIISDTNVVSLTVQAAKPTTAYRVLKGILEHYPDISELMYPGYVLEQLIPPEYPSAPDPNPLSEGNTRKYVLAAMAAMTALILLLSMFYDNVCNEKDAVNKLDARLLTTVYHEKKRFSMGFGKKKRKQSILYTYPAVSFGFVQSYKKLREKITSRCEVSGKKVILITSMLENEGKSTVAANLALSLAAVSDKVLLLDADLRRPAQYKIFDHEKHHETALSDYLKGSADLSASLFYDEGRGLYMLYNQKECMESSELESSQRMKELIETLKEKMDYIIIDTPPISQITDAEIMAQYADYSVLVIRQDNAPAQAINDCIDQMRECHAKFLGCVLNNVQTIPLLISQITGIGIGGKLSAAASYSSGYGFRSGYGYGSGNTYGKDDSQKQRTKSGKQREVKCSNDFFASRPEPILLKEEGEE